MRAVSLPRFLQSLIVGRPGAIGLSFVIALIALLAFGVLSVAAAPIANPDPQLPFRWR